ncbi:MAG: hypothetical protein AAF215_21670 [Cyanobacteria bacterium P01_A01_bin.123]
MSSSATTNGHTDKADDQVTSETQQQVELVKASEGQIVVSASADHAKLMPTNTLPNNRPIEVSEAKVAHTLSSAGVRPVMEDTIQIASTDILPGHRPIAASSLKLLEGSGLPGNRPIASNDIDENPAALMGYLD